MFNVARMYRLVGKEEGGVNLISQFKDLLALPRKIPSPRIVRNASLATQRRRA